MLRKAITLRRRKVMNRNDRTVTLLLRFNLLNKEALENSLKDLKPNEDLIVKLLKEGKLTEEKLIRFFGTISPHSLWRGKPDEVEVPSNILNKFDRDYLLSKMVAPIKYEDSILYVITVNPLNTSNLNEIRFRADVKTVRAFFAPPSTVEKVIDKLYPEFGDIMEELGDIPEVEIEEESMEESVEELTRQAGEGPIVKMANRFIVEAVKLGASDIHIEPFEKEVRVRYRVDGVLKTYHRLPTKIKDALASRYKIMSNLDIAERRKPQDGRIRTRIAGKKVDLRVSTLPTVFGEKIVMRVQEAGKFLNVKLEDLGFEPDDLEKFRRAIWQPWGMVLITGPTGSGKTTTLYSALMERNKEDVNIMTAEDPVEVSIPGINQVQINEKVGLTFASALRAFLRQDPDIILVGEIRDTETADIAIRASLTGHLVFSTLHTNDAPSTITRLTDMGIEPFLVGSSIILIVAQRLIRRLCPKCKVEDDTPRETLVRLGVLKDENEDITIYKAREGGCEYCNGSGYKGRTAVHEILEVDEEMRKAIIKGRTSDELRELAISKGMRTLYQSGILKVRKGITDIKEVNRVLAK